MVHSGSYERPDFGQANVFPLGFSGIKEPRHTCRTMLGSELGSAHVDNLEAIREESALGGSEKLADELRKFVSKGVGLLSRAMPKAPPC